MYPFRCSVASGFCWSFDWRKCRRRCSPWFCLEMLLSWRMFQASTFEVGQTIENFWSWRSRLLERNCSAEPTLVECGRAERATCAKPNEISRSIVPLLPAQACELQPPSSLSPCVFFGRIIVHCLSTAMVLATLVLQLFKFFCRMSIIEGWQVTIRSLKKNISK